MKIFIQLILLSILSCSTPLAQHGKGELPIKTQGDFVLENQDLNTYSQMVSFLIEQALSETEEQAVRKYVIEAFTQKPSKTLGEIESIKITLNYLSQNPSIEKQTEVRNRFIESLSSYTHKGLKNPITEIITFHIGGNNQK